MDQFLIIEPYKHFIVTYSYYFVVFECRYCHSIKLKLVSVFGEADENISCKNRDYFCVNVFWFSLSTHSFTQRSKFNKTVIFHNALCFLLGVFI